MESTVGERIRKLRKGLKLTQTEFGKPLDVTHATISLAEGNNEVSKDLASKISEVYNVDVDYILKGIGDIQLTKNESKSSNESFRFAEEALKRIEDAFTKENEFLKEQIRQKDEIINKLMGKSSARSSNRVPLILQKERFLARAH